MSENIFKITEQDFNEKLQSKDQQIKDLTEMLESIDDVIENKEIWEGIMSLRKYKTMKQYYQQKYPTK